jgi:hypothetical protein
VPRAGTSGFQSCRANGLSRTRSAGSLRNATSRRAGSSATSLNGFSLTTVEKSAAMSTVTEILHQRAEISYCHSLSSAHIDPPYERYLPASHRGTSMLTAQRPPFTSGRFLIAAAAVWVQRVLDRSRRSVRKTRHT